MSLAESRETGTTLFTPQMATDIHAVASPPRWPTTFRRHHEARQGHQAVIAQPSTAQAAGAQGCDVRPDLGPGIRCYGNNTAPYRLRIPSRAAVGIACVADIACTLTWCGNDFLALPGRYPRRRWDPVSRTARNHVNNYSDKEVREMGIEIAAAELGEAIECPLKRPLSKQVFGEANVRKLRGSSSAERVGPALSTHVSEWENPAFPENFF